MHSKVITGPDIEPVSVEEAKQQLNIDSGFSEDDIQLARHIKTARVWVENRLNQSLISQTRKQYMDKFPCGSIEILNGPVIYNPPTTPIAVKYYDSNDAEQTWSSSNYWFDNNRHLPLIVPKYSWPSAGERPSAIWVEYTAGFGTTADTVPESIRSAILLIVAHLYTNRVPEVEGQMIGRLQMGVESLISHHVRLQFTGHAARY